MELKDLFAAPTARLLAPLLNIRKEDAQQKTASFDVPEEIRAAIQKEVDWEDVETVYPVSAVVESYLKNNNNVWPQVYCFDIGADIEEEQIETAVQEVSRNHTAIRSLLLSAGNGHFCQVVLKTPRTQFFRVDLSAVSEEEGLSQKQKNYLSTLIRMEYSSMEGSPLFLRAAHSSALAEEGQLRLFLDVLEPKQVREILGGYYDSDRDNIGIFVETIRQLAWTMVFDSGTYEAGLIRDLSAEWIRQLKACVGTMEPSL